MHQLTKEVKDALKQFADRLPETHKPGTKPQMGAELLTERPGITGPNGEAIDPEKRYFVAASGTATNHLKRLTRAYETGGKDAVVKYLQPYEAFLGTPDTEAQKVASPPKNVASSHEKVASLPRLAEGFPEGRFEMNCATCPLSTCSASCSAEASTPAPAPKVKKRKANRVTPKLASNA